MSKVFLKLISLECHKSQDWGGEDEPYLRVDGKTIWSGVVKPDKKPSDLGHIELIPVYEATLVELWEKDTGFFDEDDLIGKTYIDRSYTGKGEQHIFLKGSGAKYRLNFEVLKGEKSE